MRDHFLSWCNSHTLACDSCCDYHSLRSWKSGEANLRREMGCAVDELVRAVEPEEIKIEDAIE